MSGKMARSDLDQAFGLPEVLVAVSTSRLSCKRAGKTRTLMPVWDSSGESRVDVLRKFVADGLADLHVGLADKVVGSREPGEVGHCLGPTL